VSVPVANVLSERLPRIFAAGADYSDVQRVIAQVTDMSLWPHAWLALATGYEQQGEMALDSGAHTTAGEAFARQALYCHFGQFAFFGDEDLKCRLQAMQNAAYQRAAPYLLPPGISLEIATSGAVMRGVLRIPETAHPPPCVILVPGADSTKEEFQTLETVFHRRGLATCSVDGPGQGLTRAAAKLRPDFEIPIGHVLDSLQQRKDINTQKIGLWGRSFGAYAALRGAIDQRLSAVVSIGGFFDLATVWARMPYSTQESIAYAMGLSSAGASSELPSYTLRGHLGEVSCPVLIVHSGGDEVCPVTESERMLSDLNAPTSYSLFEKGNHVCDNLTHTVRPLMADWLQSKLFGPVSV
jgi:dipeptidyl aminopeptidase/acylaminoacyl peptidase